MPLVRSRAKDGGGTPLLYAELPEVAIPVGFVPPEGGAPDALELGRGGLTVRLMMELQQAAWIELALSGAAVRAGEAELNVGVVPLQNPQARDASWTLSVSVSQPTT